MYDPFRIDWARPAVAAALAARGLRLPVGGQARAGADVARSRAPRQSARPVQPDRGAILQPVIDDVDRVARIAGKPTRNPAWLPPAPDPEARRPGGLRRRSGEIEALGRNAFRMYKIHLGRGWSPAEAAAWAANIADESGGDHTAVEQLDEPRDDGTYGRGLFQWTWPSRVADFRRVVGVPIEKSSEEEQLGFRDWELANNPGFQNFRQRLARAGTAADMAELIAREYERPDRIGARVIDRRNITNALLQHIRATDSSGQGRGR